jgi:hypothetical protein
MNKIKKRLDVLHIRIREIIQTSWWIIGLLCIVVTCRLFILSRFRVVNITRDFGLDD